MPGEADEEHKACSHIPRLAACWCLRTRRAAGHIWIRRVVSEVNGTIKSKPYPKTAHGQGTVPLPAFAVELLREHLRRYSPMTGEVFTNEAGGPLRRSTWRRRAWRP